MSLSLSALSSLYFCVYSVIINSICRIATFLTKSATTTTTTTTTLEEVVGLSSYSRRWSRWRQPIVLLRIRRGVERGSILTRLPVYAVMDTVGAVYRSLDAKDEDNMGRTITNPMKAKYGGRTWRKSFPESRSVVDDGKKRALKRSRPL
jgi:hypothetical protein